MKNQFNRIRELMMLNENKKFEYGCVMVYFSFPELTEIHKLINPEHVYHDPNDDSFGLEDTPHTTLLFGLHDNVSLEDVEGVLDNHTFYTCKVYEPSYFDSEKYDVLKFKVDEDTLYKVNKELAKFPHTTNFPDYNPHLTIAYLKKGYGEEYSNKISEQIDLPIWLAPQYCVYSQTNGKKLRINVSID